MVRGYLWFRGIKSRFYVLLLASFLMFGHKSAAFVLNIDVGESSDQMTEVVSFRKPCRAKESSSPSSHGGVYSPTSLREGRPDLNGAIGCYNWFSPLCLLCPAGLRLTGGTDDSQHLAGWDGQVANSRDRVVTTRRALGPRRTQTGPR